MRIEATPRNRAGELALEIYRRTLEQVRGDRLVREHVQLNGQHLFIDDLSYHLFDFDRVVVAGAGKASVAMAQGLEQVLGSRIHDGLIITKHGHGEPWRKPCRKNPNGGCPDLRQMFGFLCVGRYVPHLADNAGVGHVSSVSVN